MRGAFKFTQKQLYHYLRTKIGLTVAVLSVIWTLNSLLGVIQAALRDPSSCSVDFTDNLVGRSFESRMTLPVVDVIYTWVNGSDPRLIEAINKYKPVASNASANASSTAAPAAHSQQRLLLEEEDAGDAAKGGQDGGSSGKVGNTSPSGATAPPSAVKKQAEPHLDMARFRDNQELRYSFRSIWKFAPWVRKIFLVTNGQVPNWVNLEHPRLQLVTHRDIFPNQSHLPTFSSPAIETHLHRIPGLADKFIYFNDDVMLGNEIWPDDFYSHANGQKIFLSWDIPQCRQGCPDNWINDTYCDAPCNNEDCDFDGNDCIGQAPGAGANAHYPNYNSGGSSNRYCAMGCPDNWIGDKVCDRTCKMAACGFDAGDCGAEAMAAELEGIMLSNESGRVYRVAPDHDSFYFNLSLAFPGEVTEASHNASLVVRTAVVTQNLKTLSVLLHPAAILKEMQDTDQQAQQQQEQAALKDEDLSITAATAKDAAAARPLQVVEFQLEGKASLEDGEPSYSITFYVERAWPAANESGSKSSEQGEGLARAPAIDQTRPDLSDPQSWDDWRRRVLFIWDEEASKRRMSATSWARHLAQDESQAAEAAGAGSEAQVVEALLGDERLDSLLSLLLATSLRPPGQQQAEYLAWLGFGVEGVPETQDLAELGTLFSSKSRPLPASFQPPASSLHSLHAPPAESSLLSPFPTTASSSSSSLGSGEATSSVAGVSSSSGQAAVTTPPVAPTEAGEPVAWRRVPIAVQLGGKLRANWSSDDERLAAALTARKVAELQAQDLQQSLLDHLAERAAALLRLPPLQTHAWRELRDSRLGALLEQATRAKYAQWLQRSSSRRRMADTFGESLRYVNRIYAKLYGSSQRKAPAHMPHFMDKNVLAELQAKFPKEFDLTSQHRFRHAQDMQFSFSYYYYLMGEKLPYEPRKSFEELDKNGDQLLDEAELRYAALLLDPFKPSPQEFEAFKKDLLASADAVGTPGKIGFEAVMHNKQLQTKLEKEAKRRPKYKTEHENLEEVDFYMVGNNWTVVRDRLDEIRATQHKFICLNDDMSKTDNPDPRLLQVLHDFFNSFYPERCPFELPEGVYNSNLYLDEITSLSRIRTNTLRRLPPGFFMFYLPLFCVLALVGATGRCGDLLRLLLQLAWRVGPSKPHPVASKHRRQSTEDTESPVRRRPSHYS
eukprot:g15461.t1